MPQATPHEGYKIVAGWRDQLFAAAAPRQARSQSADFIAKAVRQREKDADEATADSKKSARPWGALRPRLTAPPFEWYPSTIVHACTVLTTTTKANTNIVHCCGTSRVK